MKQVIARSRILGLFKIAILYKKGKRSLTQALLPGFIKELASRREYFEAIISNIISKKNNQLFYKNHPNKQTATFILVNAALSMA